MAFDCYVESVSERVIEKSHKDIEVSLSDIKGTRISVNAKTLGECEIQNIDKWFFENLQEPIYELASITMNSIDSQEKPLKILFLRMPGSPCYIQKEVCSHEGGVILTLTLVPELGSNKLSLYASVSFVLLPQLSEENQNG
jgi:hypothetical protein